LSYFFINYVLQFQRLKGNVKKFFKPKLSTLILKLNITPLFKLLEIYLLNFFRLNREEVNNGIIDTKIIL